jgi:hypothetical protein
MDEPVRVTTQENAPPNAPLRITVTESMRRYWLNRFTLDEIRELAAGLDELSNDHSTIARRSIPANAESS